MATNLHPDKHSKQAPNITPRRSRRIAARRSASTRETATQRSPFDRAAPTVGGTPSKKIKLSTATLGWEQLPLEVLMKIVPWTDNRATEAARSVCRTWRQNIDSLILLKETFAGDVLNALVWKTDKLNTKVFRVHRPMRGYFRREAEHLSKFNQWSFLSTRQLLCSGTIICYMVRFPVSHGRETKFEVTGGAILRRSNVSYQKFPLTQDDSAFTWQIWRNDFCNLALSSVRPGNKWYSVAQEIVSDGVVTYEEGRRLFKLECEVPQ